MNCVCMDCFGKNYVPKPITIHRVRVMLENGMTTTVESPVRTDAWLQACRFIIEHKYPVSSLVKYELTVGGDDDV